MSAPAVPIPAQRTLSGRARAARRPRRAASSRPGCAATRSSSTSSSTCRSSSSSSSASTGPSGGSRTGTASACAGTRACSAAGRSSATCSTASSSGSRRPASRRSSGRWRRSGSQRAPKWFRLPFDGLTYVSIIVPELVIALATLVFFASTIGRDGVITSATGVEIGFGFHTIVGALSLFNISLVLLLVRARLSGMDRTHVEACYDLYGTPWRTFWQITFPQLLPAIVAGFLLSFTFAFDDYLITTFVNGQGTSTLPLYVFGQIKRGVTPATNAVAALMLLITLSILLGRPAPDRNGAAAARATRRVAGMIAEQSN